MNRRAWFVVLGLILAGVLIFKLAFNPVPDFPSHPTELTLFSIDAEGPSRLRQEESDRLNRELEGKPPEPVKPSGAKLYGYPILGSISITDPAQQREVLATLTSAIRYGHRMSANCFNPRHAIRLTSNDETVDFLICFECHRYHVYRNGVDDQSVSSHTISSSDQAFFDKMLTEAGVPLAPKRVRSD